MVRIRPKVTIYVTTHCGRARLVGWLAPRLRASLARAPELYAPGGAGYLSAATGFAKRVKVQRIG